MTGLVSAVVLGVMLAAPADQQSALTLDQAIAEALKAEPGLQAARSELDASRGEHDSERNCTHEPRHCTLSWKDAEPGRVEPLHCSVSCQTPDI